MKACNEKDDDDCSKPNKLRICCFGSSSILTPQRYLDQSHALGLTLANHGHICVNGAGSFGCMGALNEGAAEGHGNIIGVIHEMFVKNDSDWYEGLHDVFNRNESNCSTGTAINCCKSEILVAGGKDLQQRKRMLLEGADSLIVLPGGPGTWDELWEVVCLKNLGLITLPIVCVNVDGFYDPFLEMMNRAYKDQLFRRNPDDILHFETSSIKAVLWIEEKILKNKKQKQNKTKIQSDEHFSHKQDLDCKIRNQSLGNKEKANKRGVNEDRRRVFILFTVTFFAGISIGAVAVHRLGRSK